MQLIKAKTYAVSITELLVPSCQAASQIQTNPGLSPKRRSSLPESQRCRNITCYWKLAVGRDKWKKGSWSSGLLREKWTRRNKIINCDIEITSIIKIKTEESLIDQDEVWNNASRQISNPIQPTSKRGLSSAFNWTELKEAQIVLWSGRISSSILVNRWD